LAVHRAGHIRIFDRSHFSNLDVVAFCRSLQVAVSQWEIIVLALRVATLSLFLSSLLLSLLLNSFRLLLKLGGGDSIGAVWRPALDLPVQTATAEYLPDMQVLNTCIQGCALRRALHWLDPGAARAKHLAAVDGGAAPSC
jgi:hypothetical protein